MIIENQYWKFYVPDDVDKNLDKNTKRIAEIDAEILDLEKEPDEILVPNDNKILQLQQIWVIVLIQMLYDKHYIMPSMLMIVLYDIYDIIKFMFR